MAGNYPDAPSRRMAFDVDGSIMLHSSYSNQAGPNEGNPPDAPIGESSQGNKAAVNSESTGNALGPYNNASVFFMFIFPEPREIDGVFPLSTGNVSVPGSYCWDSGNTTNGYDGTDWAEAVPGFDPTNPVQTASYRDNIDSMARSNKKGMRIKYDRNTAIDDVGVKSFHIYGEIAPGETPDRILFLDTENGDAEFTKVLDFAEIPRGQTQTRTFKIINNSASLSINTIQVTAEDIYLNAGDWYEFGDDGIAYQATFAVGNLSNGAEETIHLKQVVPDGETLGVQAGRIKVSHASVT